MVYSLELPDNSLERTHPFAARRSARAANKVERASRGTRLRGAAELGR